MSCFQTPSPKPGVARGLACLANLSRRSSDPLRQCVSVARGAKAEVPMKSERRQVPRQPSESAFRLRLSGFGVTGRLSLVMECNFFVRLVTGLSPYVRSPAGKLILAKFSSPGGRKFRENPSNTARRGAVLNCVLEARIPPSAFISPNSGFFARLVTGLLILAKFPSLPARKFRELTKRSPSQIR